MFIERFRAILCNTMLVPMFRKLVPCNLRRMAACVAYRNGTRTKIAQYEFNESNVFSTILPKNIAACRMYCTESEPRLFLPMLVDGAPRFIPSFFAPFKLLYLSIFKIIPNIDKDFSEFEFVEGAMHATSLISKALMNRNYESLNGLVAEDMIETLKTKIETLNPKQRQLIAVNKDNILFYTIIDINTATNRTGDEHSINISIICHYSPYLNRIVEVDEKEERMIDISELRKEMNYIVCQYTFIRKYINNVGGPWIATFVNHYSLI